VRHGDGIVDPVGALTVVIGTAAAHNESAHLLYLGETHEPAPTACTTSKPIIHSNKWEAIRKPLERKPGWVIITSVRC
jgi:hypothetical protein